MKRAVIMNTSFALVKIHMEMTKYDNYSLFYDLRELRSALIVKCDFRNSLSYTAIMLNIMTVYHMQKASSLPKNLFAQSFNAFWTSGLNWRTLTATFTKYLIFLVIHFFPFFFLMLASFWFLGVVAVILEVSWVFIFISETRILWQGSVWLLWWSLYMDEKSGIFYLRFCDVIVHWNITENFCRRVQTPYFSM